MKTVHKLALSAAMAGAAFAAPAQAAEIQIQSQGPIVELTVNESVTAAPDIVQVGAGVQTRAPTAVGAAQTNAEKMDKVIAKLRALGIKREDIQTSNFSLNPQWQYRNDGEAPTFLGYDVSNQVNVKLRKLDQAGPILDALIAAGANSTFGPNFMLENDTAAKAAARKSAFASAEARGRELAAMAGYSAVRLLEVSETYATVQPMMVSRDAIMVTAASKQTTTPIEPGQVQTGVTLTVKYEMTR